MKLILIKNNQHTVLSNKSLEELNHQKNLIELENNELFDVCCFGDNESSLPTTYHRMSPKTIKVFHKKTLQIRNDFEHWCDVQGVEQSGGSDKKTSTIVPKYNITENNNIVNDNFNFISLTIFTPNQWYCNSVEFNAISQYYKGKHDTFSQNQWNDWYEHEGKHLITKQELNYLPFVNFIKRLGFNYE